MWPPELSDQEWKLIEPHTLGQVGSRGATGRDNRLFVNAVFYRICTCGTWRDLPARFGNWNTVARRFHRWALAGVWQPIFESVDVPRYLYEWELADIAKKEALKCRGR